MSFPVYPHDFGIYGKQNNMNDYMSKANFLFVYIMFTL